MDRINSAGTVLDANNHRIRTPRNSATGVQGTALDFAYDNALQEELVSLIELFGMAPSSASTTQIQQMLRIATRGAAFVLQAPGNAPGSTWSSQIQVPAWATACFIEELYGAGGGAGGSGNSDSAGSGSAGGGFAFDLVTGLAPGSQIPYQLGLGGLGGVFNGQNALPGGTTIFGQPNQYLWATGGGAGVTANGAIAGAGGAPGNGFRSQALQAAGLGATFPGGSGGTGFMGGNALVGSTGGYSHRSSQVGFISSDGSTPQAGGSGTEPGQGAGGGVNGGNGGRGANGFIRGRWVL